MRWAWSGTRWLRASMDFSERYSWTKPTVTTMVTATVMLRASLVLPTRTEARAETSRRRMSGSLNWPRKRSQSGSGASWGISLAPWRRRAPASAGVRPQVSDVCRRAATSAGVMQAYSWATLRDWAEVVRMWPGGRGRRPSKLSVGGGVEIRGTSTPLYRGWAEYPLALPACRSMTAARRGRVGEATGQRWAWARLGKLGI